MRRHLRRVLIGTLVLGGLGVTLGVALASGVASIAEVRVEGATLVDARTVLDASGIEVGDNAVTADLDAARARVERLPLVEQADIRRDGALGVVIGIVERRPALILEVAERRVVVDRDGIELPGASPRGLATLEIDGTVAPRKDVVRAALLVAGGLRSGEERFARLTHGPVNGLVLRLRTVAVVFGLPQEIRKKLAAWRHYVRALSKPGGRIDVSGLPRIAVTGAL